MITILIYGTSPDVSEETLLKLIPHLQLVADGVPIEGVKSDDVCVFFPTDRVKEGLGEEIIAIVHGYFNEKVPCTPWNKISENITERIRHYFPDTKIAVYQGS